MAFRNEWLTKMPSWSYSRWRDYTDCPAKARFKYLSPKGMFPEDTGPALERGSRIHKLAEDYVKGDLPLDPIPDELANFETHFKVLRDKGARVEQMWGFDKDFEPTEGFNGTVLWVKMDAHLLVPEERVMRVIDHKTGKIQSRGYEPQIELYVISTFQRYGTEMFDTVVAEFWFLDHKISPVTFRFKASQVAMIRADWERRIRKMMLDERFPATPSQNACRYCSFSKAKGGPCEF